MVEGIAFWIIVSFSNSAYNRGNMNELSIQFHTEASCQLTVEELKSFNDNNSNIQCVKVIN